MRPLKELTEWVEEGVRFDRAYMPSPVCTPTRFEFCTPASAGILVAGILPEV